MKTEHYKILTLIFSILFLISLFFNIIPNNEQEKYNNLCKGNGLDYAKVDLTFAQFKCCKVFDVSDPILNITSEVEGCTSSFDFIDD